MATTGSTVVNMVNKSLLMDEDEHIDQSGPVNLVKRVKLENEDSSLEKTSPIYDHNSEQMSLSSFFVRRRRRGRGRYAPFYIHGDYSSRTAINTNDILLQDKTSPSLPLKSIRGQFACPNCSLLFSNRDALAMHMMDSVRSQSCSGQPTSTRPTVRLPSPTAPITTSAAAAGNNLALRISSGSFANLPPLVSTMSTRASSSTEPVSIRSPSNGISMTSSALNDPYTCRLCGERSVSLDALAMHMLAHAHQEQARQKTDQNEESTSKQPSGPTKLPIAPLYFSALDFSSMQHAMSVAMSALNKAATPVDRQLHLSTITPTATTISSNSDLPPKCHSAPITSQTLPSVAEDIPQQSCSNGNTPDASGSHIKSMRCNLARGFAINFSRKKASSFKNEDDEEDDSVAISTSDREDEEEENMNLRNGNLEEEVGENLTDQVEFPFCFVCRHCRIAYEDRTMFCLHMGLHNVNNPWQCNMCGKVCSGRHEFASHSLHF